MEGVRPCGGSRVRHHGGFGLWGEVLVIPMFLYSLERRFSLALF